MSDHDQRTTEPDASPAPAITSTSTTLRERPASMHEVEGLSRDDAQDVQLSAVRDAVKDSERVHADLVERVEQLEELLERHRRVFAMASGLDPELSLDVLEALLEKLARDEGGAPNTGAEALAGLLRGKVGGQKTGGAALVTLCVYLVAKLAGVPVP